MLGNELFQTANNYLGWGDPGNGLWFIGMEEGKTFDSTVESRKGQQYSLVQGDQQFNWPVASTTAKVVSRLLRTAAVEYRDTVMWRKESKVFNGNLLPLGKPNLRDWPEHYAELFGLRYEEYADYIDNVNNCRYRAFKEFRKSNGPQAIVCFGKKFWPEYERLFVSQPEQRVTHVEYGIVEYEKNRVLLTGHFSYGRWMPKKSIDFAASKLFEWGVQVGR